MNEYKWGIIGEVFLMYIGFYVFSFRLYATFVMYGCVRDELQAMKEGLNDVIPPELLAGLTAEVS